MPIIVDLAITPGTGLDLDAIWLNTADDLSDVRAFEYIGDSLSANTHAQAEVRQLANRRRLIRRGDSTGAIALTESRTITLVDCDRTQVAWLRDRTGVLMCVRDHVGAKFYGMWAELPRDINTTYPGDRADVRLSIAQVTHSEEAV